MVNASLLLPNVEGTVNICLDDSITTSAELTMIGVKNLVSLTGSVAPAFTGGVHVMFTPAAVAKVPTHKEGIIGRAVLQLPRMQQHLVPSPLVRDRRMTAIPGTTFPTL